LEDHVRLPVIVPATLLAISVVGAANADTPASIVAVMGPSVGYMLSQNDLCQWDLGDQIRKTYQRDFAAIGMTPQQQSNAWEQASDTQKRMAAIPADGKARMKVDTCTTAEHTRLQGYLK
jgi:hypothetical protein